MVPAPLPTPPTALAPPTAANAATAIPTSALPLTPATLSTATDLMLAPLRSEDVLRGLSRPHLLQPARRVRLQRMLLRLYAALKPAAITPSPALASAADTAAALAAAASTAAALATASRAAAALTTATAALTAAALATEPTASASIGALSASERHLWQGCGCAS